MVREAYPASAQAYQEACRRGEIRVGKVLVTATALLTGPRWIIHLPTKRHWRDPSRMEWIRAGLGDLARVVEELGIGSIAIPPLGCGSGGLNWANVRPEIEATLSRLQGVEVQVYEPTPEYVARPKARGVETLTPARALMVEMIRIYSVLDLGCTNREVQKLAWFLQRAVTRAMLPDPLRLEFVPSKYGPYSDGLRHLLNALDGSYLHCRKRLADAGPLDAIWPEPSRRASVAEYLQSPACLPYAPVLASTSELISGYESPLGMELLATVDWLLHKEHCHHDVGALRTALADWPGGPSAAQRKLQLLDERLLGLALDRLRTFAG